MIKNISNLGDAAVYCDFGSEVNEKINQNVISYFNSLSKLVEESKINGLTNITPSYNKLIISFDLSITNYLEIRQIVLDLNVNNKINNNHTKIKIPICCDDEFGLDFSRISDKTKLSKEEILKLYLDKVLIFLLLKALSCLKV